MDNIGCKLYVYRFRSRFVGVIWAGAYIAMGIIFSAWGVAEAESISFDDRQRLGLSIIWGVIAFLVFLAYVFGRRFTIILRPVSITREGIEADLRKDYYEHWPKRDHGFIAWNEVAQLECFKFPDIDAMKMVRRSGVRLIAGNRKIVIYENIKEYAELVAAIKSKIDSSMGGPEIIGD